MPRTRDETMAELYCGKKRHPCLFLCAPAEVLLAKQQKRAFSGAPISRADYKVWKMDNYWKMWPDNFRTTCDVHMWRCKEQRECSLCNLVMHWEQWWRKAINRRFSGMFYLFSRIVRVFFKTMTGTWSTYLWSQTSSGYLLFDWS